MELLDEDVIRVEAVVRRAESSAEPSLDGAPGGGKDAASDGRLVVGGAAHGQAALPFRGFYSVLARSPRRTLRQSRMTRSPFRLAVLQWTITVQGCLENGADSREPTEACDGHNPSGFYRKNVISTWPPRRVVIGEDIENF